MSPSKNSDVLSRKESPFRPLSKRMDVEIGNLAKVLVVSMFLFMFLIPVTTTNFEPTTNTIPLEETASPAGEILFYSLPDTNIPITVGEVFGHRGFAYILEDESRLYFIDQINDYTTFIDLPAGNKANGGYMKAYDVDLDGHDEFFLRNYVNPTYYILMVDINDATVSEFPMPFIFPAIQGFGIFNGADSFPDLLIQNVNNRDNFLTLDVISNTTIGTFNVDYCYGVTIGRFADMLEDSIALSNNIGASPQRNITVVAGDGTKVTDTFVSSMVLDMVTFKHGGGYDEIATIGADGYVRVYNGLTLGVVFSEFVDPVSGNTRYIETGDFNSNPQDDLVVISRYAEMAFFIDGNAGASILNVSNVYTHSQKTVAVGYMDHDTIQDVTIGTTLGALGTIRGADGNFANLEYLIDIQLSAAHQILSFDANFDNREDIFCRILGDVFLVVSDRISPEITPRPINPLHPTVLDDFLTIKVDVTETSDIEYADIWMKPPGSPIWFQPQEEMYASHEEGVYYAFIGNLQPGEYQYYIEIQDSYLNVGELGNATHPLVFTVQGDFVWQIEKSDVNYIHRKFPQSDIGNLSDGSPVIYTLERYFGDDDLFLVKYSRLGGVLDSVRIGNPGKFTFENYVVFTAMLDGDNIADIIVLDYHWDSGGVLRYNVFHGSTFTLWGNGTAPTPYKSFEFLGVFDDDGDGNEELFLVSDTSPMHIAKMDSDLTWTTQNLPYDSDGRYGVRGFAIANEHIAVIRGDEQIDILSTDLAYSHSLDISLSAYTNMDSIGIRSMYDATSGIEHFVAGFNYWDATDPTGRIYTFDDGTVNLNSTPVYELPHQDMAFIYPADVAGDETDELFITIPQGELILANLGTALSTIWSTPITGATPLSATIADFDGDTLEELILFTDQDEMLTQVSFDGVVEWTMVVGEVHYPLVLDNIEQTPGVEIAAFPFATVTSYSVGAIRNLDSQYVLDVFVEYGDPDIVQGDPFWANITVANIYGEIIEDASVYMSAHHISREGPVVDTFGFYFDWPSSKYRAVTDATWPIGIANLSVTIDHGYYHPYEHTFVDAVTIRCDLHVAIDAPPFVNQGENMSIVVWVLDNLEGIVEDASVSITLDGVGQAATQSGPFYVVDYPEVQIDAGLHLASATAVHPFGLDTGTSERPISVQIPARSLVVSTDFPSTVRQDEWTAAWFNITDQYDTPVEGAIVTLVSGPKGFELVESPIPGCYSFEHIMDLGLGNQTFELRIISPSIVGDLITEIEFDVVGDLEFFVTFSPEVPVQGRPLFVSVMAVDGHGNPVPDLEVLVSLMNLPPRLAMPGDQMGEYVAFIEHVPLTEGYGLVNVTVEAAGQFAAGASSAAQVDIAPATPDFTLISTDTISLGVGASFLLSIIGMVMYFRMASSMRVDDRSEESLKRSVRNLDRLYLLVVVASGLGLVSSYMTYQAGEYGLALILTVALLGGSVLLYGLWLYRDAMSAVLVHRRLSRKRMVLGLWHLVFVPVVIVLILLYGVEIDWFKAYIIDQTFAFGDIIIPTIMTTIFTAYISSIIVVVVNLYREVSKGLKKLTKMEDAGTPVGIVQDEKTSMVSRFSSSIRIKFLMFLVVVGATTVMSMDFLASWELGIIILLPVAFLVVIPFISSKIIQVFSKMSRGKIPTAPADM